MKHSRFIGGLSRYVAPTYSRCRAFWGFEGSVRVYKRKIYWALRKAFPSSISRRMMFPNSIAEGACGVTWNQARTGLEMPFSAKLNSSMARFPKSA